MFGSLFAKVCRVFMIFSNLNFNGKVRKWVPKWQHDLSVDYYCSFSWRWIMFNIFLRRNRWQNISVLHISKCTKTHLRRCRISRGPGWHPGIPLQGQGKGRQKERDIGKGKSEWEGIGEGRKGKEKGIAAHYSFWLKSCSRSQAESRVKMELIYVFQARDQWNQRFCKFIALYNKD